MASDPNAQQDPKGAEENKLWKPRPDYWGKSGQGEQEPPSYPFWLHPSDSSVSNKSRDPNPKNPKVVDTLNKKPSDPRKLYHFLHVENQRIQLQQKTWKLLIEILQQDKKKREAEADFDKAKNQLEVIQRDEEAEKEVLEYVKTQECKQGEEEKREADKKNCEKRWKETREIVEECKKDLKSKKRKLEAEEKALKDMEEKFMEHMETDVPNDTIRSEEEKREADKKNGEKRWKETREIVGECEKDLESKKRKIREEREKFFCQFSDGKEECMQSWKYAYAYGAVGDLPMHTCFLLGLVDLGKKVIDKLFMVEGFDLISLPYIDDTEAWKVEWPKSCPRMRFHSLFSFSFSFSSSFSFSFSFSFSISFPHLSLSFVSFLSLPLLLPLFLPSSFSAFKNLVASSRL